MKIWSDEDIAEVQNLHSMGLSPEEISPIVGRTSGAIAFKVMSKREAHQYMAPIWARNQEQKLLRYYEGLAEQKVHRLQADNYRCSLCGKPYNAVCHVIPFHLVSNHNLNNLLTVCKGCYDLVRNNYSRLMTRRSVYWTQEKEDALFKLLADRGFIVDSPALKVRYLQIYHAEWFPPPAWRIEEMLKEGTNILGGSP